MEMKKTITLILAIFIFSNLSIGQSFDWAETAGGGGSDQVYAIATDGRIIVEKHMCDTQKHLEINTDLIPGVYNLHIPELDISSMLIIN